MSKVIFRRIRGRIVPVGMSTEDKLKTVGAAALGVGVAAHSGREAGKLAVKATKFRSKAGKVAAVAKALNQGPKSLFGTAHDSPLRKFETANFPHLKEISGKVLQKTKQAAKFRATASTFAHNSTAIKASGRLGSAALLGYAANKALGHTKLKDHEAAKEGIAIATAAGAAAVIETVATGHAKGAQAAFKYVAKEAIKVGKFAVRHKLRL